MTLTSTVRKSRTRRHVASSSPVLSRRAARLDRDWRRHHDVNNKEDLLFLTIVSLHVFPFLCGLKQPPAMASSKHSAREIICAVLTELYNHFLRLDVSFEPVRLGPCVVNQPSLITILENRVIRAAGVSAVAPHVRKWNVFTTVACLISASGCDTPCILNREVCHIRLFAMCWANAWYRTWSLTVWRRLLTARLRVALTPPPALPRAPQLPRRCGVPHALPVETL
jgi:hypothetical protein